MASPQAADLHAIIVRTVRGLHHIGFSERASIPSSLFRSASSSRPLSHHHRSRTSPPLPPARRDQVKHHSRSYHSHEHPTPPPFPDAETAILRASLSHVPAHGFTTTALRHGARDAGYLDASVNLFPSGPYALVNYHLVSQRLALKERVQFPEEKMGVGAKVKLLALERLRANEGIIGRWSEALALMALPKNIRPSLAELARLADEIWYLAGDTSVDTSWYTKRATLAAIYSSTELFQTTDMSPGYVETEKFLDRRFEESRVIGGVVRDMGQWVGFTGMGLVNVLRSKGMRI